MREKYPDFSNAHLAKGFLISCRKFPNRYALHINDRHYTYIELLEEAEKICAILATDLRTPSIGVYCEESVFTYAAILAVSLLDLCYVPINPALPARRINEIISHAKLGCVISEFPVPVLSSSVQQICSGSFKGISKVQKMPVQPYAYILFTSGTTGQPKGVPVSKENINIFFSHYERHFDFNEHDRFLQPYDLSFDVSLFAVFVAWNCGACSYVVPSAGVKYLNIAETIKRYGITVSSMVPGTLHYLKKYLKDFDFSSLRYSFFSGDKLYHDLAAEWQKCAPAMKIYNCYGPTETTVVCTEYLWEEKNSASESVNGIVPLGKTFDGMETFIVDTADDNIETTMGELCITGPQVIKSYLNNSDKDRFFERDGKRFYKTGDLVSVNKNGNLIFQGRKDSQVKINGFRIELVEIENALLNLTGKRSAVFCLEKNDIAFLVACVESTSEDENSLKVKLSELLPKYMIPQKILFFEQLPLNLNGKTDLTQLKNTLHAG